MIKKRVLCDHCRGSGAASDGDIHSCSECGGSGVRVVKQQIFPGMYAQSQVTCNVCGGRGRVIVRECPACAGGKVLEHTAHFTLDVPRGAPEGHEVVFEGEGDESPDWEPGDVVLRVRSRAEKGGWRRKETSLYWKETIGVDEVRFTHTSIVRLGPHLPLSALGPTWLLAKFDTFRWTRRPAGAKGRHAAWIRADHQGRRHAAFRTPVVLW